LKELAEGNWKIKNLLRAWGSREAERVDELEFEIELLKGE
jgi:hypothetical protein